MEITGTTPRGTEAQSIIQLGYDPQKQKFVGTFIFSLVNMLWSFVGTLDSSGKVLTLNSEGPSFSDPDQQAHYQDIFEIIDDNLFIFRSQVLDPFGNLVRHGICAFARACNFTQMAELTRWRDGARYSMNRICRGSSAFELIRDLLLPLWSVGTARDKTGNREFFRNDYVALLLFYFFNPTITSLKCLQAASGLENVQKKLGIKRVSLVAVHSLRISAASELRLCYSFGYGHQATQG